MIVYDYVMTADNGFAPNPYHGFCSLACCKPKLRKEVATLIQDSFFRELKAKLNKKQLSGRFKSEHDLYSFHGVNTFCNDPENGFGSFSDYVRQAKIYIIGHVGGSLSKELCNRIVYIMQVTDIVEYCDYWNLEEYQAKKPQERFFIEHRADDIVRNNDRLNCGDNIYELTRDGNAAIIHPSFHHFKGDDIVECMARDLSGKYVLLSDNFVYYGTNAAQAPFQLHQGIGHSKLNPSDEALKGFITDQLERHHNELLGRPIGSDESFM